VYACRRDGFTNEITLSLKDAPSGFKLSGGRLPAGTNEVRLTLSGPPADDSDPVTLSIEGRATIQGRVVEHVAVPAEDMMQAFAYHHLVPAQEFRVAVMGRPLPAGSIRILSQTPVKIPVGGTARVKIATPSNAFASRFRLELTDPPEGISLGEVGPSGDGAELTFKCDAAKAKPGQKGNLIVAVAARANPNAKNKAPANNNQRGALASLPAIPYIIVSQ
jgi:hypothetical protein